MGTIRSSIMIDDMMSQQFRAMNMAMATVIDSFHTLQETTSSGIDVSALERAHQELQQVEANFRLIEDEIRESTNAQDNFNKKTSEGVGVANSLLNKVMGIAGAYLSIRAFSDGLRKTVSLSDEMANTNARLNLINDGLLTTAELQQLIFQSAKQTHAPYQDTANMVAKLGLQARNAFANNTELVAFAEQINKTFKIAGTNAQGMESVMLQLTQAMAAGKLQGEELNAVLDNAQPIVANIQRYLEEVMNIDASNIKELASEGKITADIIKNAMFYAAQETNKAFESMPLTFSDVMTDIKNEAFNAFQPLLQQINEIANSERFRGFTDGVVNSLYIIAQISMMIMDWLIAIGSFVYDHWEGISAILTIVGFALLALAGYFAVAKISAIEFSIAQWYLNAAMAANPIGLVVALLILLIGLYFVAVEAINYFAGTNISAIGIIVAGYAYMYSVFYNVIAFMLNLILTFAEFWLNAWTNTGYSIRRLFGNLANSSIDMATSMIGSFDSAATNLANMFISAANMAIQGINWIIDALNKIPNINIGKVGEISARTSIVADYSGLKNKINDWVGEKPESYIELPRLDYTSPFDNAMKGYNWGANLFSGFEGFDFDKSKFDMDNVLKNALGNIPSAGSGDLGGLGGLQDALDKGNGLGKKTADNTGKLANTVDMMDEDLKYLRDIAERDVINRFTTAEIKVEMNNNNNINSDVDVDGIIEQLEEKVAEKLQSAAEGVYA